MKNGLIICWLIASVLNFGCTSKKEEAPKISLAQYKEQTDLMMNITKKLMQENDPKKLHVVADSVQKTRVVTCYSVTEECDTYGAFLTTAIGISDDGKISHEELQKLTDLHLKLIDEIKKGRDRLSGHADH